MIDRNKILLISYHYYPSNAVGAKRFLYLSKLFEEKDKHVIVLTAKEKYYQKSDKTFKGGGEIIRVKMFPPFPVRRNNIFQKGFSRIWEKISPVDSYIGLVVPGILKGLQIIDDFQIDKIVVSGPPFSSFIIAYILSKWKNKKLYLDYRDPWFLYQGGVSKINRHLNKKLEKKIIQHATKIIFNTELARQAYIKEYKKNNIDSKSILIHNAYLSQNNLVPVKLEDNKKVIMYAGNFYGERNLGCLVKPFTKLVKEKKIQKDNIKIHVFGKTLEEDNLLFEKNYLGDMIVKHEYEQYDKILSYMKGADILYLPQGGDVKYSIPYKFYDYLSVKKPILAVTSLDSATSNIMNELDCGECGEINNEESIYHSLEELLVKNRTYSFKNVEKYSWESIAEKYLNVIDCG